ncbi:CwfJ C-terminus 1-domain-containing protein-like protein [Hysterangium stoloniferum]|nr:CwfJ C-terminus 1-domain-containing protein-like protein [Hysterangium stoloniferum]
MATLKILAVGSALGSFQNLFSKIKAIDQKHGKFEAVLATGDFFGPSTEGLQEGELSDLLNEKLEVPLQVYVMQGEHPLPRTVIEKVEKTGGQICSNVYLLNKSGVFSTAHGLRIACLSGSYAPEKFYGKSNGADLSNPYFTASTLKQLLNQPSLNPMASNPNSLASIKALASFQYIDILLTHTWSTSITTGATTMPPDLQPELAPQLDELVRKTKPRYYFTACGGKFWEREPFCWAEENNRITRFVSLGHFGGTSTPASGKKERWFYAFSISLAPPSTTLQPPPAKVTPNPYVATALEPSLGSKRPLEQTLEEGENHIWGNVEKRYKGSETKRMPDGGGGKSRGPPPEGYVCRICKSSAHFIQECPQKKNEDGTRKPPEGYVCRACASDQHYIQHCPIVQSGPRDRARPRGPPREIQPDECWFCLSNPNLVKHLIVAIGSECYVTLPKGQLPPTQTPKPSPLAPIPGGGHVLIVPISHYPTLSSVPTDLSEPIMSEMRRFKSALRQCYAKYDASPVTFEVSRLTGKGGHAHVQVIPIPNKYVDGIEAAFRNHAERLGIDFIEEADIAPESLLSQNYFRVELPDEKTLIHIMKPGAPFDLQFGRMVLADLIGVPERLDWKVCAQSDADERKDAEAFKSIFAAFQSPEE